MLISQLAIWPLGAQSFKPEKDFQATKNLAFKLRETNLDSAVSILQLAFLTFKEPYQQVELLNELGRTYELTGQLDTALIVLEDAKNRSAQLNRTDLLAKTLFNIGYVYNTYRKKEEAINILQQSYQLAVEIKDLETQFLASNLIGRAHSSLAAVDSASFYLQKGIEILEQMGDKARQVRVLMQLGNNAARNDLVTKALDYYDQAIALANELGNFERIISIYYNKGYTYLGHGDFPHALETYQKAMEVAESLDLPGAAAGMAENIASVYVSINDLDQAIAYYEKAAQIREKEGDTEESIFIAEKKAEVYILKAEYRLALDQLLPYFKMLMQENKYVELSLLAKIGPSYENLGLLDSARFYYEEILNKTTDLVDDRVARAESLIGLANIYLAKGELDLALNKGKQALETGQEADNDEVMMKATALLYQVHKAKGNNSQALQYHELYRDLQDTLFSRQRISQITQLQVQSEFDQQQKQLELEREKERQKARNRQLIILIIAGALSLFLLLAYRNAMIRKRANKQLRQLNEKLAQQNEIVEGQKKQLEELDKLKSRFFTNISHEFRTPLTIIGGMIQQIKRSPRQWLDKGTNLIERNNTNLLNLVNQILDLRKLESGGLRLDLIQGNVIFYLKYILESFHSLAQAKNIALHFSSEEDTLLMDYDKEKLLQIVSNLISNAIKFTEPGGEVTLRVKSERVRSEEPLPSPFTPHPSLLLIQVTDTGLGIPEAKLSNIFDRFYQVDDSSTRKGEGTGIGLALTQELVKLMDGQITVKSIEGEGSTFKVVLPITRNAPKEKSEFANLPEVIAEIVESQEQEEIMALPVEEESTSAPSNKNKPSLLIIEDNPDLVEYLESLLSSQYDLEIARDGREGIETALEQIPDLILSDVMMPYKDGFEVCETLKNDQRTSHIPIVLLTAKADAASRIAGLKRGADAYLAKPFNQEELFIRLEKLLELRSQLQARYQSLEPQPSLQVETGSTSEDVQVLTQAEDAFMQNLREIIEANLDNENFAVPELCRAIGMSRSQLHRKIKALTNRSTTHYIRSIRLQKAKELLLQGDFNVTQVAFEVGFQNRAYFSRAFSEEFGISPKDFSKN